MSDETRSWNPVTVAALVVRAGIEALALQRSIRGSCKDDASLVTAADTRVENFLTAELERLYPGVPVLGEESFAERGAGSALRNLAGDIFIIDPIDGTAVYAAGMPGWGVSLGLASGGRLAHGAVFLPGTGELFVTTGGTARYARFALDEDGVPRIPAAADSGTEREPGTDGSRSDRDGAEWARAIEARLRPIEVREPQAVRLVSVTQYVAKGDRFPVPYTVLSVASFVVSLLAAAQGSYCAYIAKAKIWDMAAAWPIARAVGVRAELVESGEIFDRPLSEGPWVWDASDPDFLGIKEHVIFYRDDGVRDVCVGVFGP